MNYRSIVRNMVLVVVFASSLAAFAQADAATQNIVSKTANVDGVQFHYMTAGKGPAVVLIHGYAETSLMWKPIIPILAQRFTVIAPDLPGIGDSSIPADGLDMKTAATRVRALVVRSGCKKLKSWATILG